MPQKIPPTPPLIHRVIVGTVALIAGTWLLLDAGKDFEYIKFEPHSQEEIERRKKENVGIQIKHLESRTLDYTPEAKERLRKLIEEKEQQKNVSSETK